MTTALAGEMLAGNHNARLCAGFNKRRNVMQGHLVFRAAVAAFALGAFAFAAPAQAQWKPTKPITLIVPWAAGGSTEGIVET